MTEDTRLVRLADYAPPPFLVESVRLTFRLDPTATRVRAELRMLPRDRDADLELDGVGLRLIGMAADGRTLTPLPTERGIRIPRADLPEGPFTLSSEVEIRPEANTALEGLYISKGMYCTQCEAEGFRRITYYPDRPDVMARFRVRIEGDCPVLLSNGNPVASGPGWAEWDDPWPKPSYLFALVAGDLRALSDRFRTASGREVALNVWVRPGDEGRCAHAMHALREAMRWDERVYGREYDLDVFNIVAVDDFNMGAMENKGLNIFNSRYVLASPETATDADYAAIEAIVAHEYFHNWTGNRITCRDWFQLSLKEGLTVFRDQQFTADMRSAAVKRIQDVIGLRTRQFREDAGPLAHPVRPTEYREINNFYTATVYEKGAEVIRMLRRLVGPEGYDRAVRLFFDRHDGQAVTIEDWLRAFEDATGRDLSQFALWYSQAGTPRVAVEEAWDGSALTLQLSQRVPPTPGQPRKEPMVIPVAVGALAPDGTEIAPTELLILDAPRACFRLARENGTWRWRPAGEASAGEAEMPAGRPVLSVLRDFSAPVVLERQVDRGTLLFLLARDTDPFSRWDAGRTIALHTALELAAGGGPRRPEAIPVDWSEALARVLRAEELDPAFRALLLGLPGEEEVVGEIAAGGGLADPAAVHDALDAMRRALGTRLAPDLLALHRELDSRGPYSPDPGAAGRRALRNRCLTLLMHAGQGEALAEAQFDTANNMTDRLHALMLLTHFDLPGAAARLAAFRERWQDDPGVMDKWFAVQAGAPLPDALQRVRRLTEDPAFAWKTPNRFRALIGGFAGNFPAFHAADGSGYRFVADWLLRLDPVNPQTAARLSTVFEGWRNYAPAWQGLMRAELDRMAAVPGLSRNLAEMLARMRA
ncbi:MAG: aminopeptidase N [Paracoccaceae bacterium]|nr:MAG: aminopeptidase N [Paracoccaceae bacterium]